MIMCCQKDRYADLVKKSKTSSACLSVTWLSYFLSISNAADGINGSAVAPLLAIAGSIFKMQAFHLASR